METVIGYLNRVIWGVPLLILILGIGCYFSIRTRFIQLWSFPKACKAFMQSMNAKSNHSKEISGYRALCTALAATVGTGNIVGVAGAIAIGGPGVVVWMWIFAILGMVIKFVEVVLALKYRQRDQTNTWIGGPMYIIQNGLPPKFYFLSLAYAFFGIIAAFGIGNATQVNAITDSIRLLRTSVGQPFTHFNAVIIGLVIAILFLFAVRQGVSSIGRWAEALVPPASIIYIILALSVVIARAEQLPGVIISVFHSALNPKSVTGGIISSVFITLRVGASRGVFTNDAGLGTASIAHAGADTNDPVRQGLLGSMEVFLDTIVMCTLTALAILCSNLQIPYGSDPGIMLTMEAFSSVLGKWSDCAIIILICVFAFATILGWGLYGMRCFQHLFGRKTVKIYWAFQILAIFAGVFINTSSIWQFSEFVNGLMAIPNLIAIFLLFPVFLSEIEHNTIMEN